MAITVNAVTRRKQYTTSGSLGPYAFSFKILEATSLAVYVGATKKTVTTHYTTAYNSDGTGSVTFTSGNAPASGTIVTLESAQPVERTSDYTTGGDFKAQSINDDLDRLAINDQQLETNATLNVQLASTANRDTSDSGLGPLVFPYADTASDQANKTIVYNSDGTALTTGPTSSEITGATTQAGNAATSATAAAASASSASSSATAASSSAVQAAASAATAAASATGWGADVIASQAQAEGGTENTKGMTPLRTKQAIDANAGQSSNTVFYGFKKKSSDISTLELHRSTVGTGGETFTLSNYDDSILASHGASFAVNASGHLIITLP